MFQLSGFYCRQNEGPGWREAEAERFERLGESRLAWGGLPSGFIAGLRIHIFYIRISNTYIYIYICNYVSYD